MSAALDGAWLEQALCAQVDTEIFFPEKGGSTREAKAVCGRCDVRDECLEHALATDERFGIRGGLSERERRRIKKERRSLAEPCGLPQPEPQEATVPTITTADRTIEVTDYVADMAVVLTRTEAHPDKLVRDLRKLAVQAIQALQTATIDVPAPASRQDTAPTSSPTTEAGTAKPKRKAPRPSEAKRLMLAHGLDATTIRTWATEQGLDVADRGAISHGVVQAYIDAHEDGVA